MIRRRALLIVLAAPAWPAVASQPSAPPEVAGELPGARLQGAGRLTFLALHVYDARLWVADGFAADRFEAAPLALEIEYGRALVGSKIAERTLEEMRRVPGIDDEQASGWLEWMRRTFPDVNKGDRITGLFRPGESARIFHNGRLRGELRDAEFARRFVAIWLGPRTSEPKLRQSLLGASR